MEHVYTIVGALFIAWAATLFAMHRFRRQKLWEIRIEAYRAVIEALHDAKTYAAAHIDDQNQVQGLSEEQKEQLRAVAKDAENVIARARDMAGLVIHEDAQERLREYQEKQSDPDLSDGWREYLDHQWSLADDCITDLIKIARKDLKFAKHW